MWFKNINTGCVWEIMDEETQKQLKKNPNFEEVDSPVETKKDTSDKRKNPNQTKTMICDVCGRECKGQRSYTQHRRMAHGIEKDGDK